MIHYISYVNKIAESKGIKKKITSVSLDGEIWGCTESGNVAGVAGGRKVGTLHQRLLILVPLPDLLHHFWIHSTVHAHMYRLEFGSVPRREFLPERSRD